MVPELLIINYAEISFVFSGTNCEWIIVTYSSN